MERRGDEFSSQRLTSTRVATPEAADELPKQPSTTPIIRSCPHQEVKKTYHKHLYVHQQSNTQHINNQTN